MNLLEHYIKEIISEEEFTIDETWAININFVRVKMIINCYGNIEEKTRVFTKAEWRVAKSEGYYLG